MRRSLRDAIVGFTVIGGVVAFAATLSWMRGVRLGSGDWGLTVRFADAGGLAVRSPVTYRGIVVGAVKAIRVTPSAVVADLEISNADLRLPLPVTATVGSGSLLGGDAQVTLVSTGTPLADSAVDPASEACEPTRQLCDQATIEGADAPSLSTVTASLQQLLDDAQEARLVPTLADSTQQIDATAREIEQLTLQLQTELTKVEPVLRNLQVATSNAVEASQHVTNIVAALDNPQTIADLRQTATNAAELTATIDAVGGDVAKLTSDPAFVDGLRKVTIGLGELFGDVYPERTR